MPGLLWVATAPATPIVIPGADITLLYSESHGQGWAVVGRPIRQVVPFDTGVLVDHDELSSAFGGLLHVMGYRLEQQGVQLPDALLSAISDAPASVVGSRGSGTLLRIDGRWHLGSMWRFDGYRAVVSVHDDRLVGVLTPASGSLELVSIEE